MFILSKVVIFTSDLTHILQRKSVVQNIGHVFFRFLVPVQESRQIESIAYFCFAAPGAPYLPEWILLFVQFLY